MCARLCCSGCPLATGECDESSIVCNGRCRLEVALRAYFQLAIFRPGQLDVLLSLVHGRDVFIQMATGAGKSLCMFLAPLAIGDSAIAVVISPLNALMDEQV